MTGADESLFPEIAAPPRVIASIAPAGRDGRQLALRVGRRRVATLSPRAAKALELAEGTPWTPELARRVAEEIAFDRGYRAAARRIDRRPLSRREVDAVLRELPLEAALRERVLSRLEAVGLIDDERLGRALIDELRARKPAGPALLRAKLERRGLEAQLVDRLLAATQEADGGDAVAAAAALASQRLARMRDVPPETARRRLGSLLARRGFDVDTIEAAMASLGLE